VVKNAREVPEISGSGKSANIFKYLEKLSKIAA
jgi:hypothetical protein